MRSIAGVLSSVPFVASLVVASQARHELLVIACLDVVHELLRPTSPQCRCQPAVVEYRDVAVRSTAPFEALGTRHRVSLTPVTR